MQDNKTVEAIGIFIGMLDHEADEVKEDGVSVLAECNVPVVTKALVQKYPIASQETRALILEILKKHGTELSTKAAEMLLEKD